MGSGGDGEDVVELQNVIPTEERMAGPLSQHSRLNIPSFVNIHLLPSEFNLHLRIVASGGSFTVHVQVS
jgi:hypothetical protein